MDFAWSTSSILVLLFGFTVLGFLAFRTYETGPPIADRVVSQDGDGHAITEYRSKEGQFTAAKHAGEARGTVDGAVVLHELDRPVAHLAPFGHIAFVSSNFRQRRHALFERRAGRWHPRAVGLDLLLR